VEANGGRGDDTISTTATQRAEGSLIKGGDGNDTISGFVGFIEEGAGEDTYSNIDSDSLVDGQRDDAGTGNSDAVNSNDRPAADPEDNTSTISTNDVSTTDDPETESPPESKPVTTQ